MFAYQVQIGNLSNSTKKEIAPLTIFGSLGLPQYIVKGYKLYLSKSTSDYKEGKVYDLPTLKPCEWFNINTIKEFEGNANSVVSFNGYITTQQEL